MMAGVWYTFGVFFKPLITDFGWSRGVTSGVFSTFMISHGAFAIPVGWLTDRFGPTKLMVFCGVTIGLGLILSSRIIEIWQFYVTFGLLVGMGVGGVFPITTGTTARWFRKYRGLALGIVAAGTGLGTLIIVPLVERSIAEYGWSTTYLYFGIIVSSIMVICALFLRGSPEQTGIASKREEEQSDACYQTHVDNDIHAIRKDSISLKTAYNTKPLWLIFFTYLTFSLCLQMIMVHLVNYATDVGISSLVAATLVSVVGIGGIIGRLTMGIASDRVGSISAMIFCCITLTASLIWLVFAGQIWMFYLFALIFGFAYGGEVPQMPLLIGRYYGLKSVSALIGVILVGTAIGGAVGSWLGGQIFDLTSSYRIAFTLAAIVSFVSVIMMLLLKNVKEKTITHN
jgi:MFS family permease